MDLTFSRDEKWIYGTLRNKKGIVTLKAYSSKDFTEMYSFKPLAIEHGNYYKIFQSKHFEILHIDY